MTRLARSVLIGCVLFASVPATSVSVGATVSVRRGRSYGARIFPDKVFTVAEPSQVTHRRLNFRQGLD